MNPSAKKLLIYLLCATLLVSCVVACVLTLSKNDPDHPNAGSTTETAGSASGDATQGTEESIPGETGAESVEDPTEETPGTPTESTGVSDNDPSYDEDPNTPTPSTPSVIPVTGITLSHEKLSMKPGDTKTLTATISPENADNKAFTWTSSDPDVATVSQTGKVTAIKNGAATVSVTTGNGNYAAACLVVVTTEPLSASATHDVFFSNGQAAFEISITALGGTESYSYSSKIYRNGVLVATKQGDYFKYLTQGGVYRIEITVTDSGKNRVTLDPITIQ